MKEHIIKFFKQLFCKHEYNKIGFHCEENAYTRYSVRHYECQKCKKVIYVDGRADKIDAIWRQDLIKY